MPTAKSAAPTQPTTHSYLRHLALVGIGVIAGLAILIPGQSFAAPVADAGAGPSCPGWTSTTRPPDYIRVLRNRSGKVDRVPFRKYVITVMGKEWPSYLPQAVIDAGAVVVKQYAWFHVLGNGRVSRRGQCYDVTDGVGDQLYKPNRARVRQDHYTAVNATWGVRLVKNGTLFMTGYRTGNKGACGHDATGWKLYARSATRCAYRGDNYQQILRIYYGPVAVVDGGGNSNDGSDATDAADAADGSSTLSFDTPSSTTTDNSATDTTASTPIVKLTATCGLDDGVGTVTPASPTTTTDDAPATNDAPATDPALQDGIPIGLKAFTAA